MGAAGLVLSTTLINSGLALISLARVTPYLRSPSTAQTVQKPSLFLRALTYTFASGLAYLTANFCYANVQSVVLSSPILLSAAAESAFMMWFARGVCLSSYFFVALGLYTALVYAAKRTWAAGPESEVQNSLSDS